MKSEIFKMIYRYLKELKWLKHIALYQSQDIETEKNIPWNSPAVFIQFKDNIRVGLLGGGVMETIAQISVRFLMKDFNVNQLLTLEYSDMILKKLHGRGEMGSLVKIDDYTDINADSLYTYEIIFQYRYVENMNCDDACIMSEFENINLALIEVDDLASTSGRGFAKDGINIS